MIGTHLVFNASDRSTLRQVFKENQIDEPVVVVPDDLFSGSLGDIRPDETPELRINWWQQIASAEQRKFADFDKIRAEYRSFF